MTRWKLIQEHQFTWKFHICFTQFTAQLIKHCQNHQNLLYFPGNISVHSFTIQNSITSLGSKLVCNHKQLRHSYSYGLSDEPHSFGGTASEIVARLFALIKKYQTNSEGSGGHWFSKIWIYNWGGKNIWCRLYNKFLELLIPVFCGCFKHEGLKKHLSKDNETQKTAGWAPLRIL